MPRQAGDATAAFTDGMQAASAGSTNIALPPSAHIREFSMKTLLRAGITLVLLALAAPASAASIDLQNARCKNIATLREDDALLLYFWLDGYLCRDKELPVLDLDAAEQAIARMADYCAKHPDAPLREALSPPAAAE